MKVYSVLVHHDLEGQDLLGVFGSRVEAVEFCRRHHLFGKYASTSYGVVESELGQEVDFYGMVDWVHPRGHAMMTTYVFKCDQIEFTIKAENEDTAWAELDAALARRGAALAREELYGFRMPSALDFELVTVY